MEPKRIEFSFKGKRQYVTGADIFNAIVGIHPPALLRDIRLTLHGLVHTASCDVYESDSPTAFVDLPDIKARAQFDITGVTRWAALLESPMQAPLRRDEYPEDRIISLCRIQDAQVVLVSVSPFSFIDTIVAMNKYLHQNLFADAVGQWMFVGIDLANGCNARDRLSLRIGREVNYRLTRAQILFGGEAIGNLLFSLAKT